MSAACAYTCALGQRCTVASPRSILFFAVVASPSQNARAAQGWGEPTGEQGASVQDAIARVRAVDALHASGAHLAAAGVGERRERGQGTRRATERITRGGLLGVREEGCAATTHSSVVGARVIPAPK